MHAINRRGLICWAIILLLLVAGLAGAAEQTPRAATPALQAEKWTPSVVQAVYVDTPPLIDGNLDDPCWSQAARLEGFRVLDVERDVPEETVGLICVDDTAIYLAVICKDRTPEDIKAVETRRGGDIWRDDVVEFGVDPWHEHRDSYWFQVTPRGTQCEDIPGGSATKIEWRGDWTAAARQTAEGWQAEIAIPFAILRYPPGQTSFGFTLYRWFAQERVGAVYPIMEGRAWNSRQAADLVGLHPPTLRPKPILMPYAAADLRESATRFDAGLDLQYRMPSGLTALAVLNPDYSQIEDVVEPISFSYTERWLPDYRPFFITGQSTYLPDKWFLYTRRIRDFDAGVKLFGTLGKENIGLLDVITFGEENSLAAAWGHEIDPELSAGFSLVHHTKVGQPDNLVYTLGATHNRRSPNGSDSLWLWLWQSETKGERAGGYYGVGGEHTRLSGELSYRWYLRTVSPEYNPAAGYCYDQNTVGGGVDLSRTDRYPTGNLEYRDSGVNLSYIPYRDGTGMFSSRFSPYYSWRFRNGRRIYLGLSRAREFDQDSSDARINLGWNDRDIHRSGGLYLLRGVRAGGDYHYCSLRQGFRPRRDMSVNLAAEYTHLAPPALGAGHQYQTVVTLSYDLTPEKCLSGRLIARDEGLSGYAAYRQVVRRGMDAYVIVGDPDPTLTGFTPRLALKLIWVL